MSNFASKYRPEIDGLRALAVLSVVIYHAFPSLLPGGFIGVDIFFVISGYLISRQIFESLAKQEFSFADFYLRRIKRIFPALITVLLFCLAFGWFALLSDEYLQLGKHAISSTLFFANFVFANEFGYFDRAAETKPLLHLWSLSVEEQFYIIWPITLWLAWIRKINLLPTVVIVTILSFVINLILTKTHPNAAFFLPFGRFWELCVGCALAWLSIHGLKSLNAKDNRFSHLLTEASLFVKDPNSHFKTRNWVAIIGLSACIFGIIRVHKGLGFPGVWAVFPTLGAALIIAAGEKAKLNKVIFMNPVMIWFGLISYPLYLWHWPVFSFLFLMEEQHPNTAFMLNAIVISTFLAWFTFRFIERPIRRGRKAVITLLIGAMCLSGILGLFVMLADGYPNRSNVTELVGLQKSLTSYPNYSTYKCTGALSKLASSPFDDSDGHGRCSQLQPEAAETVFIGDSHTIQYASALSELRGKTPVAIIQGNDCLPYSSDGYFSTGKCAEKFAKVVELLNTEPSIKTVIVSSFWNKSISSKLGISGVNWRLAGEPDKKSMTEFSNRMKEFHQAAKKHDRRVIFMKDIPHLNFNIRNCFNIRPLRMASNGLFIEECAINLEELSLRNAQFDNFLETELMQLEGVTVFDPKETLCDDTQCLASDGPNRPVYLNGDHLTHHGAKKVILPFVQKYFGSSETQ